VTQFKARSRSVYLPAGATWYDFYTGRPQAGGRTITASAPFERMPLFVRAGSIVPTGPAVQSTADRGDGSLMLNVYTGADGSFSVYEDDGTSRQYLNGAYARIPVSWNEASKTLTIGAREGQFVGMQGTRRFGIRWFTPSSARPFIMEATPNVVLFYKGDPVTIEMR
jgi:alpha-D-xyloside xylohydrolase